MGTALLAALEHEDVEVDAVARRPAAPAEPYGQVRWHAIDIGTPASAADLDALLSGADAVVQLAWLIQPNHDRGALRQTNVDGTKRVSDAVAKAGVPQLVYVSSVGTYAPARGSAPVDESWPATGIGSSSYSCDKATVEGLLTLFERAHPEIRVARLRPALIMHRTAASEVQRYFIGRVPGVLFELLRRRVLPLVPMPSGLRLQVVHASDVAAAIIAALRTGFRGAANLAADPVLPAGELAALVGRRMVPMPARAIRPLLHAAWRARLVPVSPGWLDMGMQVPVMSTERARTELGWTPTMDSRAAIREMVDGLAEGGGQPGEPDAVAVRRRGCQAGGAGNRAPTRDLRGPPCAP